jgi:hypothetical protein
MDGQSSQSFPVSSDLRPLGLSESPSVAPYLRRLSDEVRVLDGDATKNFRQKAVSSRDMIVRI